jgi:hypothetical protein
MWSICIAHGPGDQEAAAGLKAELAGATFAIELVQDLQAVWDNRRSIEKILVLWTATSVRSALLYEIVRARLCGVVHLLAEGASWDDIPVPVRPDPLAVVAATEISRIIELARQRPPMAARKPSLGDQSDMLFSRRALTPDEQAEETREVGALRVESGKLVYAIPERMFLKEPEEIEIRIGRDDVRSLYGDIGGRAVPEAHDLPIVEVMTVSIRRDPREFTLEQQTPATQLVGGPFIEGLGADQRRFGRWIFYLTPLKSGKRQLFIEVAGQIYSEDGHPGARHLPTKTLVVDVRISGKAIVVAMARSMAAFVGVTFTAVIGAVTQEWWWPPVREFLATLFR